MTQAQPALSESLALQMTTVLKEAVVKAGLRTLDFYDGQTEITEKKDNSPLTEADLAADAIIADMLQEAFPSIPIISEETIDVTGRPSDDRAFFLVDPLDGTREFIKRNGEYTINIAYVENGIPLTGAVYAPAMDRLYWGAQGYGAFCSSTDELGVETRLSTRTSAQSNGPIKVAVSRSHLDTSTQSFIDRIKSADVCPMGSSLKLCLVAAGEADVYPRFGTTCEWDIAAGHAIVVAAGGEVYTIDGNPLYYGKWETDLRNPAFIACSPDEATASLDIMRTVLNGSDGA